MHCMGRLVVVDRRVCLLRPLSREELLKMLRLRISKLQIAVVPMRLISVVVARKMIIKLSLVVNWVSIVNSIRVEGIYRKWNLMEWERVIVDCSVLLWGLVLPVLVVFQYVVYRLSLGRLMSLRGLLAVILMEVVGKHGNKF